MTVANATVKVVCEHCEWAGRRRVTTRAACPKCGGMDVWQVNREGFHIGRGGPVEASPIFEVNDLGHLRVYDLFGMVAFNVSTLGYLINKDEAGRLGKVLTAYAKSK